MTADLQLIQEYQNSLKFEKLALLRIGVARKRFCQGLEKIIQDAKLRSIRREVIIRCIERLSSFPCREDEMVLAIPVPIDFWSVVRAIAETSTDNEDWRQWDNARRAATGLQNSAIARYCHVVERIILRHFRHAPNLWDDLQGEGLIGMIRGLETFDPALGINIEAHLQARTLSEMLAYLAGSDQRKARDAILALEKPGDIKSRDDRSGQDKKRHFGIELTQRNWSDEGEATLFSIDQAVDGDGEGDAITWSDTIPIEEAQAPFDQADRSLILERLYKAAATRPGYTRLSLGLLPPEGFHAEGKSIPLQQAMEALQELAIQTIEGLAT